jgi:putative exporter of polyketide antibiotics
MSFGAAGALLASFAPRATVAILTALTFAGYLVTQLGPLLKLSDWVLKLSPFSLYDSPLTNGVYWTGLCIMLGVTIGGFGLAGVLMQRRDVGA